MLPKVATHILHHTSRAAAAVQNQTTHTIRNVLQLQSSSGPTSSSTNLGPWSGSGSSSSNWGSNGPGPGGAKYNAGSRFHHGYTGAGRAVTQANTSTSNDGSFSQGDDGDDIAVKRVPFHVKRSRLRSTSLSLASQSDREQKLGVLKTIRLHVRSRHAFARLTLNDALVAESSGNLIIPAESSRSTRIRRNSTSTSAADDSFTSLPPPSPPPSAKPLPSTDPAAPQTITPPPPEHGERLSQERGSGWETYEALKAARNSGDPNQAAETVLHFRNTTVTPSVAEFNMAIEALHETRRPGEPLNLILETYNDMLSHSLLPNIKTYFLLILALTDRDHEIHKIITALEVRGKRRAFVGRTESTQDDQDGSRIKQLRAENNFGSAMSLFEAVIAINGNARVPLSIYTSLLRSCAYHSSIEGAIHTYAQLERRNDIQPSALIFTHMISAYMNNNDLQGAIAIFEEFKSAAATGRVSWHYSRQTTQKNEQLLKRSTQLQVWNKMIEAYFRCGQPEGAMALLEEMMDSQAGPTYGPADVPPPASSTFTQVVSGFCNSGDVRTALVWFDRLLEQHESARDPFESNSQPPRPDQTAWIVMLDNLATEGHIDDLNRLFATLLEIADRDSIELRPTDRLMVFQANMQQVLTTTDHASAIAKLNFLTSCVIDDSVFPSQRRSMTEQVIQQYVAHGDLGKAIVVMREYMAHEQSRSPPTPASTSEVQANHALHGIRTAVTRLATEVFIQYREDVPFVFAMQIAHLLDNAQLPQPREFAPYFLHAYGLAKRNEGPPQMTIRDWELLGYAATSLELPPSAEDMTEPPTVQAYAFAGIVSLVEDFSRAGINLEHVSKDLVRRIVKVISVRYNVDEIKAIFSKLGPSYEQLLESTHSSTETLHEAPATDNSHVVHDGLSRQDVSIDMYHSRFVDEFFHPGSNINVHTAYSRFKAGLKQGKYPTPVAIGHLITTLGRLSEVDKVRHLYSVAQDVLASMDLNKKWQSQSWFLIEDSMIIALAHAGDLDSAHVHRVRILEQGGAPTADAYGALIQYVKDTTDDTSNAMALFQESKIQGIRPNLYLYNNIISKLAKARKADFALELFHQMRASEIQPSSITYGALIGACARVGDHNSAEVLFDEMTQQRNFRPRIPPYNTMMQLYTMTKPNRERVLHYYHALIGAGIKPTAHTYKLLIDAYGSIEPIDLDAMGKAFHDLENDPTVLINGSHWAALINAWGCVRKDLDKAVSIFESIASHPKSTQSPIPLPDAVVYEAMINVFVVHRRPELMRKYIERLNSSGIHMTAYIANFLIKGYAIIGDIDRARQVFESLADPRLGMAAPNNHVPHDSAPATIPASSPVYREPSTWEVMVRAELGSGNRDRALALLERLQARQFPEGVYNRISGIMLDDSVSPWASSSETSSNSSP